MADSLNENEAIQPEGEGDVPAARNQSVTISDIEKLFVLMRENEIAELEIEQDQTKIHIVSKGSPDNQGQMIQYMPAGMQPMQMIPMQNQGTGEPSSTPAPQGEGSRDSETAPATPSNTKTVLSPMVGTFYRSPGPDSGSFVNEGDIVNEESVLCIIEAMKLMNEIKAETRGKIVRILVENGMPVEFNQPLFLLEP